MSNTHIIKAKKSLGQHFLNSKHVLQQIITAANIKSGENILEIGPGTGVLTEELLKSGAKVISIEKDVRSNIFLREKFVKELENGQLNITEGDVLEIPNEKIVSGAKNYALIANIPYYITGAILEKFLEQKPRPDRMVLLVQKEVAERILSRNGKESILSISVKAFGTPKIIAKVPPGAFTPPPTVDSAILAINNISDDLFKLASGGKSPNNVDISSFFSIVKAGFAHKRKFLKRNLETVTDPETIESAWKKLNLNEKIRAEDMKLKNWISLSTEFEYNA